MHIIFVQYINRLTLCLCPSAHESVQPGEPAGGSGVSGGAEERSDWCT